MRTSGSRAPDWLSRRPAAGLSQQHVTLTLYAALTTDYSRLCPTIQE